MRKMTTNYIMQRLYEKQLFYFDVQTLAVLLGVPRTKAYQLINSLKRRGFISKVEKGKYVLLGFEGEKVLSNPFFIATRIAHPAYISYWSALHFYGFTEQVPLMVYVVTTRKKKPLHFNGVVYKYIVVQPYKFFGYRREILGDLPVLIADKEKAIIDSLDQMRYAGGLVEVAKCLYNAREELDLEKLVEYANAMQNKSLCSRLGYLLELFGCPVEGLAIAGTFVKLDPEGENEGSYYPRWRLRLNIPGDKLLAWRET